ncbi:hypothetical protein GGR50DRAFT_662232 [Xylaria sp. CBS 124048]|nr:hypothetical protein GGR50DRAFT_662232 [Xylaria sp. CBS 124048]
MYRVSRVSLSFPLSLTLSPSLSLSLPLSESSPESLMTQVPFFYSLIREARLVCSSGIQPFVHLSADPQRLCKL